MSFKCPECGKGMMILETVPYHSAKLSGTPIVVKDAQISKCDACDEFSITATELRRWRSVQYCVEKWKEMAGMK